VLNQVESTEYSRATTVVYTQEYPITVHTVGIGQMSRLNARCLPINLCFLSIRETTHPLYTHMTFKVSERSYGQTLTSLSHMSNIGECF